MALSTLEACNFSTKVPATSASTGRANAVSIGTMRGSGMSFKSAWIGESSGLAKFGGSAELGAPAEAVSAGAGDPWPSATTSPDVAARARNVRRLGVGRESGFMGEGSPRVRDAPANCNFAAAARLARNPVRLLVPKLQFGNALFPETPVSSRAPAPGSGSHLPASPSCVIRTPRSTGRPAAETGVSGNTAFPNWSLGTRDGAAFGATAKRKK